MESEKKASLDLLTKMESDSRKMVSKPEPSVLNVRKAIRFESKGRGGAALARGASRSTGRTKGRIGRGRR